LYLYC